MKYKNLIIISLVLLTSISCGQEKLESKDDIQGIDIPPGGGITIRTELVFGDVETTSAGITEDALAELARESSNQYITSGIATRTIYTEKDLWQLGSKVDSIAILYKHTHSSSGRWSIHIDDACGIVGLDFVERGNDLDELIHRALTKYYEKVCCK